MNWISFLNKTAQKFATKEAIEDLRSGRVLNYSELLIEVNRWVSFLLKNKVSKGQVVCLIAKNRLEHLTIFFACARLGAIFLPMNWRLGEDEKKEILDQVKPILVLTEEECHLADSLQLKDIGIFNYPESDLSIDINSIDPLLMLFTSGSTGMPKGVLLHSEMLNANTENTCKSWGLLSSDETIIETPFFHTGGYNVLCLPLLSLGGKVIISQGFCLETLYELFAQGKISVYFGVPTMFQQLAEDKRFENAQFKSLRFLISGGAYCDVELIKKYQTKGLMFKQGFGLTEVGPNCFLLDEEYAISKLGSIGVPMPHSQVKIIKDGREVLQGEVGELVLAGPHVCGGYYKNDQVFHNSFFQNYFRTGDLARCDSDGFYYIVGRIKDMYISGGENVYPAEVEKRMNQFDKITDSVVVAVEDEKWGEVGLAFYRGEETNLEEVKSFLTPKLSRYKQPHYVTRLEEFPLLANGKINRVALKEMATKHLRINDSHRSIHD
ncbi:MAG: long-chain fatty acid--CoA ligase [Oligoflexia bacterium]|nr:long-chain fatty acid--CoA ligase [Oligoflexia bacterium]